MINSRFSLVSAAAKSFGSKSVHQQWPLIPKLRGHFAEFLNHGYLDRLSILYLTTCVGLGYKAVKSLARGFSWQHGIIHLCLDRLRIGLRHMRRGFAYVSSYNLAHGLPSPWLDYPPASPHCLTTTGLVRGSTQLSPKRSPAFGLLNIAGLGA